ncbi:hypothetical protein [Nonomuraea bangladeshensis]|uniref:hypothetical protein n=1 Tax=Nonomuraea bangladeshensis TaxID=404385 RepID=UPI003C2C8AFA
MSPFSVVRWLRAASFAAACAGLATLGHLAGGGAFDPAAALAGLLLLLPPALALTRRERSLGHILPATALAQVLLHVLLSRSDVVHEAMGHPVVDHHTASPSLGMVPMHALGVLLTSVWLRWVEEGLCALVRQLAGWALQPLLVLLFVVADWSSARPRANAPRGEDETCRAALVLRYAVVRRGPPAGAGPAVSV